MMMESEKRKKLKKKGIFPPQVLKPFPRFKMRKRERRCNISHSIGEHSQGLEKKRGV